MNESRAARFRRPGGLTGLVTGLVAAAVVASGCSVIPSGGGPQPAAAPPPPAGAGPCCGLVVRPPQVGWSPAQVVTNFLLASAIGANNYAVARQYLTKKASEAWRPGAAVTILTREPVVSQPPGQLNGPPAKDVVLVRGQEQATLSPAGQYIPASAGATARSEEFYLQYDKGLYKISSFPTSPGRVSNELMLTPYLFALEYTPRNLYYYGGRGSGALLPYPVFVPAQGTDPAAKLINDLISGPSGWLASAARTAFPAGAHLARPIQVFPGPSGGRTAVVDIAVPRHSPGLNVQAMAAQLVSTLTSPVYSTPLYRSVKLEINGRPWPRAGATLGLGTYESKIPHSPSGEKAYYLTQGGGLRSLTAKSDRGSVVFRGPGSVPVTLSHIAVSPDGRHLAGLGKPADTVFTGNLVTGTGQRQMVDQLKAQFAGTSFTSLSWDRLGDLWVTGTTKNGSGVWVFRGGTGPAISVTPPRGLGQVTYLRVAPDGNRVAMIVGSGASAHLVLAAAMPDHAGFSLGSPDLLEPSLRPVSTLTWYDEDHLLVVTGSAENSQLWEVPVDGGKFRSLGRQPGIISVAAAGPRNPLYVGLAGPRLERAGAPEAPLGDITAGQAVIYPG